jgi:hypothetical protein
MHFAAGKGRRGKLKKKIRGKRRKTWKNEERNVKV